MTASSVSRLPLHKELLVAVLVGGLFGPLIGWLGGMLAMFFASATIDETRGMRTSAFIGGLMGIPLGALVGIVVCVPLRILSSRVLPFLKNVWFAAALGAAIGCCCGFVVLMYWNSRIRRPARNVRRRNGGRNNRARQTEMVVAYGAEQIVGRKGRERVCIVTVRRCLNEIATLRQLCR